MEKFLESLIIFVGENPESFLLLAGIAIIVLGLVGKFSIPKIGEVGIEPENRRLAVGVGMVLVAVGAGLLVIQQGPNGPKPPTEEPVSTTETKPATDAASVPPTITTGQTATEDPKDLVRQTVSAYYDALNRKAYKEAWDLTSPEFQNRQDNGITGYESYWRTVDEVEIVEFEPAYVSSSGRAGEVVVSLMYHLKDTSPNVRLRFCLVFDDFQGGWLIEKAIGTDRQC